MDAGLPHDLELRQQLRGTTHEIGIARHPLCPAVLALDDEPRAFQDGDVLLHRRERHLVARGQLADRRVGVQHARQNVAAGGVGERPEHLVQVTRRGLLTCNHTVVYHAATDSAKRLPSNST